jgi:RNA polymerase sigma factor (sigma-70 family)
VERFGKVLTRPGGAALDPVRENNARCCVVGRHARLDVATVVAARDGDQRSLEELVAEHLPLVYNIVGRALNGHSDVDDVVQETMLRVVRKVHSLRDSSRFRAWLVAIAMQQIRARARARKEALARGLDDEAHNVPDPGADFVDLTITQLGLAGQRKEVAEATRWLDEDDRRLLSLWWLEAAGEISRDELASALNITTAHAAVRVQRMKNQLHAARAVVRALWSDRHCTGLIDLLEGWDAKPSPLWRKRLVRHSKGCPECGRHWSDLVPAERLLAGVGMLPVAAELASRLASGDSVVARVLADPASAPAADPGLMERVREQIATRPGVRLSLYTGAVVLAIGAVYVIAPDRPLAPSVPGDDIVAAAPAATDEPEPTPTRSAAEPRGARAERAAPVGSEAEQPAPQPGYGSNVDVPDAPPPADRRPGTLPRRPEGSTIRPAGGNYVNPYRFECAVLQSRGQNVVLKGRGYFKVWWTVGYYNSGGGEIAMPTWTGLKGKLFHAASGGGHRMDDTMPGTYYPGNTWMGKPGQQATLPRGAQQMWQAEFYYLDGEVTLNQNEGAADYDLMVMAKTWSQVTDDLNQNPDARNGVVRYGKVRDNGGDGAPVPQYLTRGVPSDPRSVAQRSAV